MIEKLVRWLIKNYLPGFHLHRDPGPRVTAVVNSPKEAEDAKQVQPS